ncbi:PKD domain-containing protein [Mucilaginibacter sp. OK098]|uniref:PKD domain-containing protein n=1 Tax=Mucilaginibacter sp. OK098 TaxID=1855297 RepID=UPI00091E0C41|nr:PKD domain-containing protein [Mucilaginibacter sp. OK098]SHN30275.1 PKD domain-containing protein [Mucilaginibacter sp. OK098]
MNKKLIPLICAIFIFCCYGTHAQSVVNANPLTGTANVMIPIYTINSGEISVPISLTYQATGVKPKDVEGTAGMGWQLNAGGQISRLVRGLPDDCYKDNSGASMPGWMSTSNTAANAISGFGILNNGSTCANETPDITYINSHFSYNYDTEPDMFYVSAPGLSCQLVYDRSDAKFHPVNYQDFVITYTTAGGTGNNANSITTFTITTDKGIKYVFAAPESVTQITQLGTGTGNYFATQYKQYQNGINYSDSWNLTGITDANGNGVVFTYIAAQVRNSTNPVILYLNGSTTNVLQYKILQAVTPQTLNTIGTTNINQPTPVTWFIFGWNLPSTLDAGNTGQTVVSSITGMGRGFQFNYNSIGYSVGTVAYHRKFLASFSDPDCSTPVNYQFNYNSPNALPDSASTLLDYWGYYSATATGGNLMPSVYVNPAPSVASYPRYLIKESASPGTGYSYTLSGNNRAADPTNVMTGSLSSITYAQGGSSSITYESNDYFDAPSGTVVKGGGIRVNQIVDKDNITNTSIIRNYSYLNSSGVSSGKPLSLPQFAFTIPYSGTATGQSLWTDGTALSADDLSADDHTIMYTSTKVSQTSAGSTVYNYNIPATAWDVSASPSCSGCTTTEWAPTTSYIARNNCSSTYGPVKNDVYSYPFIPNANYDFERGILQKVTNYNDAGTEVSEENYTYQRSYAPSVITALKYDDNPSGALLVKSYNKYTIYYNTSELTATVAKKVFDSPTLSQAQTSTVSYTYGSTNHKLLTQQSVTNSDNNTVTTRITYTKDYAAAAGANPNVNAIYYLEQQNINIPVETYRQVTNGGGTATTSANLTLYSASTIGAITHYMPSQQLKWVQPDGGVFTPLSISGQTLTKDAGYFPVANYDTYDNTGFPLTVDDANKHIQTTIHDYLTNQVTTAFKNANYNEVAFNDFDSMVAPPVSTFSITGTGAYTPVGSHAGNAAGLYAGTQTVASGTLSKNTAAKNYIFSIWINANLAGTLTLSLSGISTHPVINYPSSGWQYYEVKIPAATLPSSFTVSFTSNQNISIDDILFYPDVAEAATVAYESFTHHKIAETNTNGVSTYYTSDKWGRLLFKLDQDKNIIEKRTYITPSQNTAGLVTPAISYTDLISTTIPKTFIVATTPCITGTTYAWNFGDGTPVVIALDGNTQAHTYSANGDYTITVTATNPAFATVSSSTPVSVRPPLIPSICQSGAPGWNSCNQIPLPAVTCGTNPHDDLNSYYTVTSVINSGFATLSYQWQISYDGGATWTNAGTNTTQFSMEIASPPVAYQVRCIVSAPGQQSGTSNIASFVIHC